MVLSYTAILILKGSSSEFKQRLADALGVHEKTIYRYIADNEENGMLTTASALRLIRNESGLDDDQLLDESKVVKA